jgi:hypothetical protein
MDSMVWVTVRIASALMEEGEWFLVERVVAEERLKWG